MGRTRGGAQGNDERDQTLNQMLSEMDGFQNSSQVIVMAATNRQGSLVVFAQFCTKQATVFSGGALFADASTDKFCHVNGKTAAVLPSLDANHVAHDVWDARRLAGRVRAIKAQ